jgi:hypothetical protein
VKRSGALSVKGWFFEIVQNAPGAEEDLDGEMAEFERIGVKSETIDGDAATVVTIHVDFEGEGSPLTLVKEDGKWQIDDEGLAMAWKGYVGEYQLYY